MSIESPDGADTSAVDLHDELASAFEGAETSADDAGTTGTVAPDTAGAGQIESFTAPTHWADADKALFGKAPRDIQKRWLDREGEFSKGLNAKAQEAAQLRREWESIERAFQPFERDLGLRGVTRQQFLGQLINVHKWLVEDPAAAMQWISQQYEVDLSALNKAPQNVDPVVQSLQSKTQQLERYLQQQEQQRATQEHAANLSRVTSFAEAKDANGKPLHPHFDDVAAEIVALMKAGERDLETAYKKAVRMNDEIWQKVQSEQLLQTQQKQQAEQKQRLDRAKRASVGTEGQNVQGSAPKKTLRDELSDAFSGLQN